MKHLSMRLVIKMKMHYLSFLIACSFTLSACGNNNSSDNQQSNTSGNPNTDQNVNAPDLLTKTQHWTTYRLDVRGSTGNINQSAIEVVSADLFFINDTTYFLPDNKEYEDNYIFVTKDGEYRSYTGQLHPEYGAESGKFKQLAPNEFTLIFHSEIGSTGLEEITRYKAIDLNNQNVLKHLTPELHWQLQYPELEPLNVSAKDRELLTRLNETKFPQGSICLQIVETQSNQDYLTLSPLDSISLQEFETYEQRYNQKDPNLLKMIFKNTTAYLHVSNTEDKLIEPVPSNSISNGFAQYKSDYYRAYYTPNDVNDNLQDWIEELKQTINQSDHSTEAKKAYIERADSLTNMCDFYNPTAMSFIKSIVES